MCNELFSAQRWYWRKLGGCNTGVLTYRGVAQTAANVPNFESTIAVGRMGLTLKPQSWYKATASRTTEAEYAWGAY